MACEIVLHLCFSAANFIPMELFEWPITLMNNQEKRLRYINLKIITYSEAALLRKNDILIRLHNQQITNLAEEYLRCNKIQQIVRS